MNFVGFGETHTVVADTILKAIDLITTQLACFQPTPMQGKRLLRVRGYDTVEALATPVGGDVSVDVWPAYCGGKSGGFLKIALGVVLIAAMFIPGVREATLFGLLKAGSVANVLFGMGASMILGGFLEMLSPAPKIDLSAAADPEPSKYLAASQNTTKIGTRIPLAYGTVRIYGHYISFDVDAVDV